MSSGRREWRDSHRWEWKNVWKDQTTWKNNGEKHSGIDSHEVDCVGK